MALLISGDSEAAGVDAVTVLNLPGALAILRIVNVAENSEEPRAQTCPALKFVRVAPCSQQGVLDEVISHRDGSAKRNRKRSQTWNLSDEIVLKASLTHRPRFATSLIAL